MTTSIQVSLEFTPNPDTLKYVTSTTLLSRGTANFKTAEEAESKSLLATELFKFKEISAVMIGPQFVTITLADQSSIQALNDAVITTIRQFLESGKKAVETVPDTATTNGSTEIEKKILEILDRDIRPAVAMDGGDIVFEKYLDGVVYLSMQGSCSGCPSSLMTLKHGVETRLKNAIPEIQEVIPV